MYMSIMIIANKLAELRIARWMIRNIRVSYRIFWGGGETQLRLDTSQTC